MSGRRRTLVGLAVACALMAGLAAPALGQKDEAAVPEDWERHVREVLQTPPGRPRRAMLVFPLVKQGTEEEMGWGRGLIAMQAMWRSSFAPDRLLDTWDYWMHELFVNQQLLGADRRVTPEKIEEVCAHFGCENYTTGTLKVTEWEYSATVAFHGENGGRERTYEGPRKELYRLPCRIAADVVDYLGVETTPSQRRALAAPAVTSTDLLDRAAEHYPLHLNSHFYHMHDGWWSELYQQCHTQWAREVLVRNALKAGAPHAEWRLNWLGKKPRQPLQDMVRGETLLWRAQFMRPTRDAFLRAARQLLPVVEEDPYNVGALRALAYALSDAHLQGPREAIVSRFELLFGDSPIAWLHQGIVLWRFALDRAKWLPRPPHPLLERKHPVVVRLAHQAGKLLDQALEEESHLWQAYFYLMRCTYLMGKGRAYRRKVFERLIKVCPTYFTAYRFMYKGSTLEQFMQFGRRCAETELYQASIPRLLVRAHWDNIRGIELPEWSPKSILSVPKKPRRRWNFADFEAMCYYFRSPRVRAEVEPVLGLLVQENRYDMTSLSLALVYAYWNGRREWAEEIVGRLREMGKGGEVLLDPKLLSARRYRVIWNWLQSPPSRIHDAARAGWANDLHGALNAGTDPNAAFENGTTPLHLAARFRRLEALQVLLERRARPDPIDGRGRTPLHWSTAESDDPWRRKDRSLSPQYQGLYLDLTRKLLEAGADPNAQDEDGMTPLIYAAKNRDTRAVRALLQHGARVELANKSGHTPLHLAMQKGDKELARLLLQEGANISAEDENGLRPIQWAAGWDRPGLIGLLAKEGADIEALADDGITPLRQAVKNGQAKAAGRLLELGAEVDHRKPGTATALMWAAHEGDLKCVRLLLEHGADVSLRERRGRTAMHYAAEGGHPEVMARLVERGAKVTPANKKGFTPLHLAVEKGRPATAEWLIEHGADLEAEAGDEGSTPLHHAARWARPETAEVLIRHGADVNHADANGRTPLHRLPWALERDGAAGDVARTVRVLVENGAELETYDRWGNTPLHLAAAEGALPAAEVLLEQGADVHAGDRQQRTPLHKAVKGGHAEMVRWLVRHGADVNRGDKWPLTPLHRAASRGQAEMAERLLELGADPTVPNNDDLPPAELAEQKGHAELAARLRRAEQTAEEDGE